MFQVDLHESGKRKRATLCFPSLRKACARHRTVAAFALAALLSLFASDALGQAGSWDTNFDSGVSSFTALALQDDGKILVARNITSLIDNVLRSYVARLQTNGMLDTDFNWTVVECCVNTMVVQRDGKILLGESSSAQKSILRLNPDGSPDESFGSAPELEYSRINQFALQPDGKILVGSDRGLHRLESDGRLDATFGAQTEFDALRIGLQANGKIIATTSQEAAGSRLIRIDADGSLDQGFVPILLTSGTVPLAIQPDDKILIGGSVSQRWITRFDSNGLSDPSFASGALVSASSGFAASINTVALQPDGKIIFGGAFDTAAGVRRKGIGRLNSDGTLDRNFDCVELLDLQVDAARLQSDGKIIVAGNFWLPGTSTPPLPVRPKPLGRLCNDSTNFPGRVEFSRATYTTTEEQGGAIIPLYRLAGQSGTITVQYKAESVFGPGLPPPFPPTNSLSVTGTVTFASGQTSNFFLVPIVNNDQVEGNRTLRLSLANPGGGAVLGSQSVASLLITEDDISIGLDIGYTGSEAAGEARVTVFRFGVTNRPASALFQTRDGTAIAGLDYTPQSTIVSFAPGETQKTILIPIADDLEVEGDERFNVTLSDSTGAAISRSNAVVSIVDDVTYFFVYRTSTVSEKDTNALIRFFRYGRTNCTVSFQYDTIDLTATAGRDYVAQSGVLTFAPGEMRKDIIVPIIDDRIEEEVETFAVRLSNPVGPLLLGDPVVATISISSDDPVDVGALVRNIIAQIDQMSVAKNKRPFLALLEAALESIERTNFSAAINQLEAFQNKVRAQVAPLNTSFANELIAAAQSIIESIGPKASGPKLVCSPHIPVSNSNSTSTHPLAAFIAWKSQRISTTGFPLVSPSTTDNHPTNLKKPKPTTPTRTFIASFRPDRRNWSFASSREF